MSRREKITMQAGDGPKVDVTDALERVSTDHQLESLVSRIVRLEKEKRETGAAVKDCYVEAKAKGLNVKALRIVVKRQLETSEAREKREEAEAEAALLESRLGTLATMPLGRAAIAKAHAGAETH